MRQTARHDGWRTLICFLTLVVAAGGISFGPAGPNVAAASSLRRTAEVIAVEQARPSVVNIHGRKTINSDSNASGDGIQQVNGMGTGIVIDERGYIVTNYHVVQGVGRIQVTTSAGRTVTADLIAHDAKTDLAIIKIDIGEPLPVIRLGTSRDLMTGEPVIAIGNAYGYTHTVTRGIISALHRPIEVSETQTYQDLIQTDASINPGNSGGPLLNIDGDMIGINVAVRMGAQGIGFALPVDEAMEVVADLIGGEVTRRLSHGFKGKTSHGADGSCFAVVAVDPSGPAQAGGLRAGDVIVALGDRSVSNGLDCQRLLLGYQPGDEVRTTVIRGNSELTMSLVLSEPEIVTPPTTDRAWQLLGVRLTPASTQIVRQSSQKYRGGMRVTAVRPGSPAAREGIRSGDILVGLHKWETTSLDNISYILDSEEFANAQPAKFYILRGSETLFGMLRVTQRDGSRY